jgi:hypothetical protein
MTSRKVIMAKGRTPSRTLRREAERHRSRTCLASGYDAVLVLKTSWGTGPGRSDEELSRAPEAENRSKSPLCESDDLAVLAHAPEESSGWTVPPMKAT